VAETSLTVPGIRYVIDSGTARVKRYSYRSKVEQLLVEPVSQAAAQQRSGRCGRVANGICIRLYDEKDFTGRPRFTDPEILRSSLAGVILRMKSLHLGDVERFPFVEAPRPKAIADGYQLLAELGAVDDQNELTQVGRDLAHWPLDPRVGRMVLEARQRQALAEVLIVASALSVQDVRDRPLAQQTQADQAQAQFKDERSEFSGYLTLWYWLERQRGGAPQGQGPTPAGEAGPSHKLSNRQFEQLLRQHFINPRRLREWRDVYSQLLTVVNQQGWQLNTQAASYEQLHCSMLAGLLGNIGWKPEEEDNYLGARGIRFYRHPGAQLRKKPGRWVVCAELVETTRLFGRGIANIEPRWLEDVGGHLLRKQVLDPKWDRRQAEVQGMERATLYGLVVYSGRRVPYARVDLTGAREIFIREGLVEGQWDTELPFLSSNQKQIRKVMDLEHKSRRQDVLVDEALIYAFYDQKLPAEVCNGKTLERWYRQASRDTPPGQPAPLTITQAELMRHEAAGVTTEAFPKIVRLGGVDCAAQYLHEPGDARDGLTITVPLFVLNQVNEERTEWLVPGMLKDKIQALLKSLPQKPRARLVPLPESAHQLAEALSVPEVFANGSLFDALQARVKAMVQLDIKRSDFKADMVSPHLFMNIRVVDEHGRQLAQGRNLGTIKSQWGSQARGAFQALAALRKPSSEVEPAGGEFADAPDLRASPAVSGKWPPDARRASPDLHDVKSSALATSSVRGVAPSAQATPVQTDQRHTRWTFGELPELMEIRKGSQSLVGFPALVDQQDAVTIEVFDEPELAAARHRGGLRRLFALQIRDALKYLEKNIPGLQAMVMAYMQVGKRADGSGGGTADELLSQLIEVAMDRAFLLEPLPHDESSFQQRLQEGRGRLNLIAQEVARLCSTLLTELAQVQRKLKDTRGQPEVVDDLQQQLQRLMGKRFLVETPYPQLQHFARYLKAMQLRLDKLRADPARDAAKRAELKPLDQRYWRLVAERKGVMDERSREYRWLLEELRVSFFAQELRTPQPVSVKRLDKAWALLVQ
jgi:ATP-dependent helicase HrpA